MKLYPFTIYVIKKFIHDDCFYRASALTFTSLLSIVPLMYVCLAILSFLPVSQHFSEHIQNFIFQNFVPATGKVVQFYFQQFSTQTKHLPIADILFLFTTVFFMMLTVEKALNIIWKAPRSRHNFHALLLCLSILCLLPLLLGLSLTATSYFLSLPFLQLANQSLLITKGIPFIFSLFGFMFLYTVLPNCSVKISTGLLAGCVAAIAFELTKHGFVFYLSQFNSYQKLYGAFAVIPVFFIWVYIVWLITLFGAEIGYVWEKKHHLMI